MTVRFSEADLQTFATASHDRNPLHLSSSYARKTPFGQPVVFGALGALAVLARVPVPPDTHLSKLSVEFPRPIFTDVDYQIAVDRCKATLGDGSTVLVKVTVEFSPGRAGGLKLQPPADPPVEIAATPDEATLVPGLIREGSYQTREDAVRQLADRFALDLDSIGTLPVTALLWSSYYVGMILPGERALFYNLLLRFENSLPSEGRLLFQTRLQSKNALSMLRSEIALRLDETHAATGEVGALLRPEPVRAAPQIYTQSEELKGKTAVIVGASRGLGAEIAGCLVSRGATVVATFQHSAEEAARLQEQWKDAPGRIVLRKGDTADLEWCQALRQEFDRVDFLVLNACPTVLSMRVEAESVERVNAYLAKAFSLVSVPLSVMAGSVDTWIILISSAYVQTAHKDFPQYVAAKAAAEGFFRVAAQQVRKPGYLIVRPPKVLTDMTNTPYGRGDAKPPSMVADQIVQRLCVDPGKAGELSYLEF